MEVPNNNVNKPIFTKAELKVVELLSRGLSEKEIADELNVSTYTVNNHMKNIRNRNHLTKNTEVVMSYLAYLRGKKFSVKLLREFGASIIFVILNVCEYSQP